MHLAPPFLPRSDCFPQLFIFIERRFTRLQNPRGLSDGLLALAQISSARDRLATISLTAQDAAQLIRTVDGDTELEDARDAVGEIGVRLTVASTSLAVASSEIQQLTDREAQSGDGHLALVSQRIKSARHLDSHASARSTTQRRAGYRFLTWASSFSSPMRRICA